MNKIFNSISRLTPGRSMYNLSYEKKFTCDMGQIIPVMCDEVVPGDFFMIGNQAVVRFMPMVAPILHEINMRVKYFFVPYRLLWDDWVNFITGGVNNDFADPIPTWDPAAGDTDVGGLWDYLGFPIIANPDGVDPVDFPRRAYNLIYNEFYRDEDLVTAVAADNVDILNCAWEKDYFTSARPSQQRGTAPALPIAGTTSAVWDNNTIINNSAVFPAPSSMVVDTSAADPRMGVTSSAQGAVNMLDAFNDNVVDLSVASTFDISDLRTAFQLQKWQERNMRGGIRYPEFLLAHFNVAPRDERLQRPEFIGGTKCPVVVSEVLQTSSTDGTSPQGNLAGHGLAVSDGYAGKYHVTEFGLIMGLMTITPRSAYSQGVPRQWIKETKYDFFFPEFAHLSEQAVYGGEVNCQNSDSTWNTSIWGYQSRYSEMRSKQSIVCGELRTTFDYWHLAREFNPAADVDLDGTFLTCTPSKRIFASQSDPGMIVSFANHIKAFRPLSYDSSPGLIDHF